MDNEEITSPPDVQFKQLFKGIRDDPPHSHLHNSACFL